MSAITCHVLDTTLGRPAQGMEIALLKLSKPGGPGVEQTEVGCGAKKLKVSDVELTTRTTDAAGRCDTLTRTSVKKGTYKLVFNSGEYYKKQKVETFWPVVEIIFNVADEEEAYHIPLLINPFSFTSYKGQHGGAKKPASAKL